MQEKALGCLVGAIPANCRLRQQGWDFIPYTWPTPEQFKAMVGWLGDWPDFQAEVRPAGPLELGTKPRMIRTWLT